MGFNAERYGVMLYSLRRLRGYKTAAELARAVSACGVPTTESAIWAIERGDREAKVGRHLAFMRLLRADADYFDEALEAPDPNAPTVYPQGQE